MPATFTCVCGHADVDHGTPYPSGPCARCECEIFSLPFGPPED